MKTIVPLHLPATGIACFALCTSLYVALCTSLYVAVQYYSWRDRIDTLSAKAIAQAPLHSDSDAIVVSKDAGLFAGGYKLFVKVEGQDRNVYVSPDDYLAAKVGQKICVKYKSVKGAFKDFDLCGNTRSPSHPIQ